MDAINSVLTDFVYLIKFYEKPQFRSLVEKNQKDKRLIKRALPPSLQVSSKCIFDVKFQDFKDVYNTKVFQDNFQRPPVVDTKLVTYVTMEDVKDVVLYTGIYDIPKDFIKLFLSDQVNRILRSLVLYMQYFLEIFRTVVKRREAVNTNKLRHPVSACVETLWKETLSNLRFILARDYCHLLMGMNGTAKFHHYDYSKKLSRYSRDLMLYQLLHIYSKRVVEVVLLEKGNPLIEEEMERLFRVGGPKVDRKKKYGLTQLDLDILEHNFTVPTLHSKSVISKEFARHNRNTILKYIGQPPWLPRDAPSYFLAIEMALAGGESRFVDANIRIGILGFERNDFDCFLNLETIPAPETKSGAVNEDGTQEGTIHLVHRLRDKSVRLTGPAGLLPMRDENIGSYSFEEKFLGHCENFNEQHMKIRKPRWIAFRKANSRLNYEPESDSNQNGKDSKNLDEQSLAVNLRENGTDKTEKKKKGLPSFFFSTTVKSDSEDDIYTPFHEGFYNEQVKKMAMLNNKK